jgi:hypothetical protein
VLTDNTVERLDARRCWSARGAAFGMSGVIVALLLWSARVDPRNWLESLRKRAAPSVPATANVKPHIPDAVLPERAQATLRRLSGHVRSKRGVLALCALSFVALPAWARWSLNYLIWAHNDRPPAPLHTVYVVVNGSDTLSRAVRAEAERHHVKLGDKAKPGVATVTIKVELALKRLGGPPHVLDYAEAVEEARAQAIADTKNHLGRDWQWSIQPGDFLAEELSQNAWRLSGLADEPIPASPAAGNVHAACLFGCGRIFAGMLLTAEVSEPGSRTRQVQVSAVRVSPTLAPQALFMLAVCSLTAEFAHPGTGSAAGLAPPTVCPPPSFGTALPSGASGASSGKSVASVLPPRAVPAGFTGSGP